MIHAYSVYNPDINVPTSVGLGVASSGSMSSSEAGVNVLTSSIPFPIVRAPVSPVNTTG